MLDALRQTRALSSCSDCECRLPDERPIDAAGVAPTDSTPPLPPEVAAACDLYGFGDRDDVSRNYNRALLLHAAGRAPEQIIAEIRRGADIDGLFV